jgi:hypothetical protein
MKEMYKAEYVRRKEFRANEKTRPGWCRKSEGKNISRFNNKRNVTGKKYFFFLRQEHFFLPAGTQNGTAVCEIMYCQNGQKYAKMKTQRVAY